MKTAFGLLLAVAAPLTSLLAADYVYPTSTQGYLLSDDGTIVEIVPRLFPLELLGEDGQDLIVRAPIGVDARIHRDLVHRSPEFASEYSSQFVTAMKDVVAAEAAVNEEEYDKAGRLYAKAITSLRDLIGDEDPFLAWLLAGQSWVLHLDEDLAGAERLLGLSQEVFAALENPEHPLTADVLNTLAVVRSDQEDYEAAEKFFHQAIRVVQAEYGLAHIDAGVIYRNLADCYETQGDYAKAIQSYRIAIGIYQRSLPESAIELALLHDVVATSANDGENYRVAETNVSKALQLYDQFHPEYTFERLDARLLQGSVLQSLGKYSEADQRYADLLNRIVKLEKADADYYRKETHNRRGVIDYLNDDFVAAMDHFSAAARLQDKESLDQNDALAQLNIGNTFVNLGENESARKAFEASIAIYKELEDDAGVAEVEELLADAVDPIDTALDGILLVSIPKGFLRTRTGLFVESVPGYEVLTRIGDGVNGYTYSGNERLVIQSRYVRSGRMLPGYGEVDEQTFRSTLQLIAEASGQLAAGKLEKAYELSQQATQECKDAVGTDNTLFAFAKIHELGFLARLGDVDAAGEQLNKLDLSRFDQNQGYPISIQADLLRTTLLPGNADLVNDLKAAREFFRTELGDDHIECMQMADQIAAQAFTADPPQHDLAIQELAEAIRIGKLLFPENSPEVVRFQTQRALAMMSNGQGESAIEELNELLEPANRLDAVSKINVQATLARLFAGSDRQEDADDVLLNVDLKVLTTLSPVENPEVAFVYQQLAGLHLRRAEPKSALSAADSAIEVLAILNRTRSFQASEARLAKAKALKMLDEKSAAADELNAVLSIYKELGGGNSPQAEEVRTLIAELGSVETNTPPAEKTSSVMATDAPADTGGLTDSIRGLVTEPESLFDSTARLINKAKGKK